MLELPVHDWPQGNGSWKLGAARVDTSGTFTWFGGSFGSDAEVGAAEAVWPPMSPASRTKPTVSTRVDLIRILSGSAGAALSAGDQDCGYGIQRTSKIGIKTEPA
ncbi:hypothetical protein GCM10009734_77690 [Nonomuraea bangladeshensis]